MSNFQASEEENKLIYIGDPMCSWCYGFGPEITQVKRELPPNIGFQVVVGGLRPHGTETMTKLGDFLQSHWQEINEKTGQPFKYEILKNKDFIYDTEPACRAVVTARNMDATKELLFFKAIQTAFYANNHNTNLTKTYVDLAGTFGFDKVAFEKQFLSEEMKAATAADFELSGQFGVNSFPTVILKKGDEYFMIGRGYVEAEKMMATIGEAMK
ncbi:MAG: DsbA family protein [Saprospiraceae bacterium]